MVRMQLGRIARSVGFIVALAAADLQPALAEGPGDLLVAPTRLELSGGRGAEVLLNNIGTTAATYRISLEFRRMTPDGNLVDVDPARAADHERIAEQMIVYAPRRVTLEPNQPQSIRVGVRPPVGLPDGEYRVHMLFRAIPDARPATAAQDQQGISIDLRPIYGVTIPVIVRSGQLAAQASIAGARLLSENGRQGLAIELKRTGNRSLYGDIEVRKPGIADPVLIGRGVAIYTEIEGRSLVLPAPADLKTSLAGPATIRYVQRSEDGAGKVLAEAQVTLR